MCEAVSTCDLTESNNNTAKSEHYTDEGKDTEPFYF